MLQVKQQLHRATSQLPTSCCTNSCCTNISGNRDQRLLSSLEVKQKRAQMLAAPRRQAVHALRRAMPPLVQLCSKTPCNTPAARSTHTTAAVVPGCVHHGWVAAHGPGAPRCCADASSTPKDQQGSPCHTGPQPAPIQAYAVLMMCAVKPCAADSHTMARPRPAQHSATAPMSRQHSDSIQRQPQRAWLVLWGVTCRLVSLPGCGGCT